MRALGLGWGSGRLGEFHAPRRLFFWRRTESSRIEELWDRERGYKTTGVKGQEEDKKALKKPLLPFATLAKRIRGEIDDTALFSLGQNPFKCQPDSLSSCFLGASLTFPITFVLCAANFPAFAIGWLALISKVPSCHLSAGCVIANVRQILYVIYR